MSYFHKQRILIVLFLAWNLVKAEDSVKTFHTDYYTVDKYRKYKCDELYVSDWHKNYKNGTEAAAGGGNEAKWSNYYTRKAFCSCMRNSATWDAQSREDQGLDFIWNLHSNFRIATLIIILPTLILMFSYEKLQQHPHQIFSLFLINVTANIA